MSAARAVALAVLLVGACRDGSTPFQPQPSDGASRVIPGQYIVVFRDTVADPVGFAQSRVGPAQSRANAQGGTLLHTYTSALKGFAARLPDAAVATLRQDPRVAYVEPDRKVTLSGSQQMDANGDPWGLDRIDQRALPLDRTYTYASRGAGVFLAVTAGNHNVDACLEASGATPFAVAASTRADAKADFSNWGTCIKIYAPGVDIKSTWLGGVTNTVSGTSFAAPHVTGVAALYKATFGDAPSDTVAKWILSNATPGVITGNPDGTPNLLLFSPATAQPPPVANFTFSCSGLTCNFDASSSTAQAAATYGWTWGDATTGSGKTTTHTYTGGGTYNVTLTVTDAGGSSSGTQPVTVTAPNQPPTAHFTFSCTGLRCSFTSTSSDPDGSIAGYSWTFGDGGTATAQNPSHTYGTGGSYTVTLTVSDNQGATSSPVSKTVTVTAPNQPPTANFTFSCSGLSCSFTSTSSDPDGTIASYSWTFGDGATATAQNPAHSYGAGGRYKVTLRDTDHGGATSPPTSKAAPVRAP